MVVRTEPKDGEGKRSPLHVSKLAKNSEKETEMSLTETSLTEGKLLLSYFSKKVSEDDDGWMGTELPHFGAITELGLWYQSPQRLMRRITRCRWQSRSIMMLMQEGSLEK